VITEALKVMVCAVIVAGLVLAGTNIAIQRYVCGLRWGNIDPLQVQRCEPVGLLRSEMEKYRRLADDTR